jgi:hypothetical protein
MNVLGAKADGGMRHLLSKRGSKTFMTRSMARSWFRWGMQPALLSAVAVATLGPANVDGDEAYFARHVYPVLETAECNLCHNDNGVAAGTLLEFPSVDAEAEQVAAFGLRLLQVVDRENPDQSLLLLKPTNREEHSGGERIKQGSDEESILLHWIHYLAGLSDEQVRQAEERISRAERRELSALTVRRLTHSQYNHTVRDLLGDQSQPANGFPKEDFIRGFKNQLEGQGITPLQAEAYGKSAEWLALSAFRGGDHRGLLASEPESLNDAACADKFVRQFGLRAYRRPLTDEEVSRYRDMCLQEAHRTGDFLNGAKIVVETMLQSPHFLLRVERGAGGLFEQFETASRLAYFIWDTMPSDEMLRAAQNGEYGTVEQIEAQARRMLDDPRAKTSMEEFLAQWLRFDRVLSATRDRRRYRQFNAEVAEAMVEETRQLFNHQLWEDQDFMEFYTAEYTFLSTELARLYDLPAPSEEFAKVNYPAESGRSGMLGHGSFLVGTSKPAETSPTERGLFIRNQLLGQEVPAPPPGVNTALPAIREDAPMTNRQRLQLHLNSESCSGCHRLIDPIGLGFEQYDAIGVFHTTASLQFGGGRPSARDGRRPRTVELDIDSTGYIQGIEGSEFSTPKQLGRILANNEASQKCIVKQLFRYAFGREETVNDQPVVDELLERFRESGFRFRELIIAIVTSELFLQ